MSTAPGEDTAAGGPAARPRAWETVLDRVETDLAAGRLHVGDRLPPERELAASLGASRVTLRSALGRLADARLLSVRQGSGYVVRDFRRAAGPDLLPALAELARGRDAAAIAADLLLVRRQLAAAVLERLAGGVGEAALARISAAIDALEARAAAGASSAALAEADVDVVSALLAATRSPVLQLCLNPILSVLATLPALRDAMYAAPATNVVGWRMLVEWTRTGERAAIPLVLAELGRRDEATLARLRDKRRR
ncbi:MAG TPA: GntR family transcriptional regulator [Ideonella sp.]|nr:GntR family transcriptional regulator [Ideonella sp.]